MSNPGDRITFWADHRPALEDGDYSITITQHIETKDAPPRSIANQPNFSATRNFSVLGPRFALDPQEVRGVFPPEGSLGEHSNVLPHIIFNRATLPWERTANPKDNGKDDSQDPPWLALLVFHEGEEPEVKSVKLSELGYPGEWDRKTDPKTKILSDGALFYVGLKPETGQHADDLVQLVKVSAGLLTAIVPARDELAWLAHVRQATDVNGNPGQDADGNIAEPRAVLFANRLPKPDGHTTVHLVSLEGLYSNGDFIYKEGSQDICLVSLKSWRFACVSSNHDFKNLLLHLDYQSFRLPTRGAQSEPYLREGLAPFQHLLRQGNRSVSWYRGPLLPGNNPTSDFALPVQNADSLVRFYQNTGMFDITYAAAWELGRMLTIQNKRSSVDLFNWKRAHAQQQKDAENLLDHLPLMGQPPASDLPDSVTAWFKQLSLLNGIPFNYLVPDEKMLPPESIRFFQVDPIWIECLLDGAFGIGRVSASDFEHDQSVKNDGLAPTHPAEHERLSGFLLRSSVVSGYPDLLVDGYGTGGDPAITPRLKCVRMERLSSSVLLCLFAGTIQKVNIHQKPESLHFGFSADNGNTTENPAFRKELRDQDGRDKNLSLPVIWRIKDKRVVKMSQFQNDLRTKVNAPTSTWNIAQFAMEMIEGVDMVQFSLADL